MFVYQEFAVLRETIKKPEERLERPIMAGATAAYSNRLQAARIRQRLSVSDLSARVGVTHRSMSLYENGSETPSEHVMKAINAVLKIEA